MPCDSSTPPALIIGGGASGLMAGALLPHSIILERLPEAGRRILVTGGGRCNLTHSAPIHELVKAYREYAPFVRPALEAFPPDAQRAWFHQHGVPTKIEDNGRVFPQSDSAASVRQALLNAVEQAGSRILTSTRVTRICVSDGSACGVELADGTHLQASRVFLAAGGAAQPTLGTDGSSLELAASAGLPTTPPLPALGSLVFQEAPSLRALAGLTLPNVELLLLASPDASTKRAPRSQGSLLLAGESLSGPCAMDLCAHAARLLNTASRAFLRIRWRADFPTPEHWLEYLDSCRQHQGSTRLLKCLSELLPRSLCEALCYELRIPSDTPIAHLRKDDSRRLTASLSGTLLPLARTESLRTCKGSSGGVLLKALHRNSLQARAIANLYCLGEATEVIADCGGYNLAWAWASAFLATHST